MRLRGMSAHLTTVARGVRRPVSLKLQWLTLPSCITGVAPPSLSLLTPLLPTIGEKKEEDAAASLWGSWRCMSPLALKSAPATAGGDCGALPSWL